ncbi:MAG: MFS transporter [Acetobacter sp.]|uniref:MFS transporter n=1 Tax=Acetobacter sp. TaxID=440 RepID=UPI0039EB661A
MNLQDTSPPLQEAPTRFRFVIYALIIAMCVVCYGDRAALSVAMPSIATEFGLTSGQTGWVLSSFLWSYFILNLPSAILLDRLGTRVMGVLAVTLWSMAMILGSLSASIGAFIATRVLLGIGEAPAFPLGNKVVRLWAPVRERGAVMTAFVCGIPIGLACGAAASTWLITCFGWRTAFASLGVMGLLWAACWLFISPRGDKARDGKIVAVLSVPTLFRCRAFWGIVISQCCANYANFLLMSWMPIMLRDILHLSLAQSGTYTACANLGAALLSLVAGKCGEYFVSGHALARGERRRVVSLYLVLASVMGFLPFCHTTLSVVGLLAFSLAFVAAADGANMALLADLLVDHELLGSVTGLTMTFSNGIGILAPIMTGYLLQGTGSFHAVFYIMTTLLLLGALNALILPRSAVHARPVQTAP